MSNIITRSTSSHRHRYATHPTTLVIGAPPTPQHLSIVTGTPLIPNGSFKPRPPHNIHLSSHVRHGIGCNGNDSARAITMQLESVITVQASILVSSGSFIYTFALYYWADREKYPALVGLAKQSWNETQQAAVEKQYESRRIYSRGPWWLDNLTHGPGTEEDLFSSRILPHLVQLLNKIVLRATSNIVPHMLLVGYDLQCVAH